MRSSGFNRRIWEHEYLTAVLADEQLSGEASQRGGVRRLVHEGGMVRQIALSPDGRHVAMAAIDHSDGKSSSIAIRELSNGNVVQNWNAHRLAVLSLAYSPNGQRIVNRPGTAQVQRS